MNEIIEDNLVIYHPLDTLEISDRLTGEGAFFKTKEGIQKLHDFLTRALTPEGR